MSRQRDLPAIEKELQKRLAYPYSWGRRQSDDFDRETRFIYQTFGFEDLLKETALRFQNHPNYANYQNYALNRWYNFWSSQAVEGIFCSLPGVRAALDPKDRLVDFSIKGITFDHKTSVFPKNFSHNLSYSQQHPRSLIQWLYENQSQEGRKHLRNRLFIVLHAADGEHWKLKSEISLLRTAVETYLAGFSADGLHAFQFQPDSPTLSDIIWVREQ
jgi:hypothetical protein